MQVKYIVSNFRFLSSTAPGVIKKINNQVAAFAKAGFKCEIEDCGFNYGMFRKISSRIPFFPDGIRWKAIQTCGYDVLYIRRPVFCSKQFIDWLKRTKEENPTIRILLEFQTYPYDGEYSKLYRKPLIMKDKAHRGELAKYVDRAVDLSGTDEIFGMPTLQIINGINLSEENIRQPQLDPKGVIRLVSVAVFNTWHGIDRLIRGMAIYCDSVGTRSTSRQIVLHLVGDGPALGEYRKLVQKFGLEDIVVFHGLMLPEEFEYLYNECDLAIASLGLHRKGIDVESTLKTREYLAKGIPFAYSGKPDVLLDEPADFCLKLPADETPVDVESLITFRDRIYARERPEELSWRIRAYAERHVSMDAAMRPVIDYLLRSEQHDKG